MPAGRRSCRSALFGLAVHRRIRSWWLLIPLAPRAWALVHASGVHATVAGCAARLHRRPACAAAAPTRPGLAEHFEHRIRPLSAGFAVPIFAFFAAGVAIGGLGLVDALSDRVALGIVAGLVVGKLVGVLGTTFLARAVHPRRARR